MPTAIGLDPQQSPSLAQVMAMAMEARLAEVHVGMPGTVLSYNPANQTATVQLALQRSYEDATGARQVETIAPLQLVPVVWTRGGGARMTMPLAKGDPVWVQFSESCIDQYILGSGGGVSDPGDDRRHAVSDAVCYPGCSPFKNALKSVPTDAASFGMDDGPQVNVTDDQVQCGGTSPLALKSDLTAINTAIAAAIAALGAGFASAQLAALQTALSNLSFPVGAQVTTGA